MTDQATSLDERVQAAVRDALAVVARNPAAGPDAAASLIASAALAEVHRQPAGQAPAAEYTPDWPAVVNRLSAELEEEREARRAWRRRAEAAGQAPATDQNALRDALAAAIRDATCTGDCGQTEEECAKERIQPFVWHHGRLAMVEGTPEQLADAVLPALPAPADQAATLRGAVERAEIVALRLRLKRDHGAATGAYEVVTELRRMADETQPAEAHAADLSDSERTMLAYALDQAQERIWSEGGFSDEDQAAVDSLRRLTAAERQDGARP